MLCASPPDISPSWSNAKQPLSSQTTLCARVCGTKPIAVAKSVRHVGCKMSTRAQHSRYTISLEALQSAKCVCGCLSGPDKALHIGRHMAYSYLLMHKHLERGLPCTYLCYHQLEDNEVTLITMHLLLPHCIVCGAMGCPQAIVCATMWYQY